MKNLFRGARQKITGRISAIFRAPIVRFSAPELLRPYCQSGDKAQETLLGQWRLGRFFIALLQCPAALAFDFTLIGFGPAHVRWRRHTIIRIDPLPPLGLIQIRLADRGSIPELFLVDIERENRLLGCGAVLRS